MVLFYCVVFNFLQYKALCFYFKYFIEAQVNCMLGHCGNFCEKKGKVIFAQQNEQNIALHWSFKIT